MVMVARALWAGLLAQGYSEAEVSYTAFLGNDWLVLQY